MLNRQKSAWKNQNWFEPAGNFQSAIAPSEHSGITKEHGLDFSSNKCNLLTEVELEDLADGAFSILETQGMLKKHDSIMILHELANQIVYLFNRMTTRIKCNSVFNLHKDGQCRLISISFLGYLDTITGWRPLWILDNLFEYSGQSESDIQQYSTIHNDYAKSIILEPANA